MESLLAVIMIIDVYVIIYYRLLVKHHYETEKNIKETAFAAIFSFPPHAQLSETGKQFSRRYWFALIVMFSCILILVGMRDFSQLVQ